jgi:hypothetical protein
MSQQVHSKSCSCAKEAVQKSVDLPVVGVAFSPTVTHGRAGVAEHVVGMLRMRTIDLGASQSVGFR